MFLFDTEKEEDEFGQDGWLAGGYKLVVALLVAERCQLKTFTAPLPLLYVAIKLPLLFWVVFI